MTRTKEQIRKAVFAKLRGLRRKLLAAGVPCTYSRSVLLHENGSTGFSITYQVADDRTTLLPQVSIRTAEGTENLDHLPLDQGIARIKQLLSAQHDGNGQEGSGGTQTGTNGRDGGTDAQDSNSYVVVQN